MRHNQRCLVLANIRQDRGGLWVWLLRSLLRNLRGRLAPLACSAAGGLATGLRAGLLALLASVLRVGLAVLGPLGASVVGPLRLVGGLSFRALVGVSVCFSSHHQMFDGSGVRFPLFCVVLVAVAWLGARIESMGYGC